jgi:hypothetical protein
MRTKSSHDRILGSAFKPSEGGHVSLPVPILDDKTWTQIVEEARSRIPRHSQEWTDWNTHDPGITFIELFAWLADIQRYRLDQVSAETNRRFFKLIQLRPHRLRPAMVWVSFDPLPPDSRPWLLLAAGLRVDTPVLGAAADGFDFEVARDTFVTSNRLRSVITDTGSRRLTRTEANASPEISYYAFGQDAPIGAVLEVEFENGFQAPEFELHIDLFEDDLPPPAAHADENAAVQPSVDLIWEYHAGGHWQKLNVLEDISIGFHQSGPVRFETPPGISGPFRMRCRLTSGAFEIPPRVRALMPNVVLLVQIETEFNELLGQGSGEPDQAFRLRNDNVLECRFEGNRFQIGHVTDWARLIEEISAADPEPDIAWLRDAIPTDLATSGVKQLEVDDLQRTQYSIARAIDEALADPAFGEPGSAPDHAGRAAHASGPRTATLNAENLDILSDALPGVFSDGRPEIETGLQQDDRNIDWTSWRRVKDFFASGPKDRHYMLNGDSGEILFGNGLNGEVPARGAFVRARRYRHTAGARGNVPTGQRWTTQLQGTLLTGTNLGAAAGGGDPEAIAESRARAEQSVHERSRAITAADVEALACRTPGCASRALERSRIIIRDFRARKCLATSR